jgi:putative transposase
MTDMKKSRFTEAQIIGFLRQAEAGIPIKEVCRNGGLSDATFYKWRSKLGGMEASSHRALSSRPCDYLYFAAVMNWPNDSHHTMTAAYFSGSIPAGTVTTKFSNVVTSPTRTILFFKRLKSASVSTNSGDR